MKSPSIVVGRLWFNSTRPLSYACEMSVFARDIGEPLTHLAHLTRNNKGFIFMTEPKTYEFQYINLDVFGSNHKHHDGGFIIRWGCKGIGFGEATFVNDKERGLIVETECMGKEFLEALMKEFVSRVVIVE